MPLAAASAESPIATRIPLMVNTAVHRLCSRANMALVQPIVRICRSANQKPRGSNSTLGDPALWFLNLQ